MAGHETRYSGSVGARAAICILPTAVSWNGRLKGWNGGCNFITCRFVTTWDPVVLLHVRYVLTMPSLHLPPLFLLFWSKLCLRRPRTYIR